MQCNASLGKLAFFSLLFFATLKLGKSTCHQQLATKTKTGMHSCRETCIDATCMIKRACVLDVSAREGSLLSESIEARNKAVLFPASTNGLTVVRTLFLFSLVLLHNNTAYNCHIG